MTAHCGAASALSSSSSLLRTCREACRPWLILPPEEAPSPREPAQAAPCTNEQPQGLWQGHPDAAFVAHSHRLRARHAWAECPRRTLTGCLVHGGEKEPFGLCLLGRRGQREFVSLARLYPEINHCHFLPKPYIFRQTQSSILSSSPASVDATQP